MNLAPRGSTAILTGINNEQREDLQKKSKRGQTEGEQWYAVWNILFANTPRPDSPYMDFEQSRDFASWVEFCQGRGAEVVAEEVSRHVWGVYSTAEGIAELVQVAQSGFRRVFEEFQAGMGALPPPEPPSDPPSELSMGGGWKRQWFRVRAKGWREGRLIQLIPCNNRTWRWIILRMRLM
jgi:hypothetical protein